MENWNNFFSENKELIDGILKKIDDEKEVVYPDKKDIFKIFDICPPNKIKVIILGQDSYHNGSANGIAFSIKEGNSINSSLNNLFKEVINSEYTTNKTGNLELWAKRGVFLLNTALSVIEGKPE